MTLEQLEKHKEKNEPGPLTLHTHRINLRYIIDLNVKPSIINLLEQNIQICLRNVGVGKDFLKRSQKALNENLKIGKLDLIKIQVCS